MKENNKMGFHMQILIALLLGIKRNWHIFLGLILGVICGIIFPKVQYPVAYKVFSFIGQAFINTIQMVVIPLVISAIVIGISSIGDNKQLAKFGKKMIFYYAIITVAAVAIGAFMGLIIQPGVGAREFIDPNVAQELQGVVASMMNDQQSQFAHIFLNLIPQNPFHSLSMGEMIPIIIFVLIFAIALSKIGEINRPVVSFFESVFAATMKVTDWIMYLAAPGIFALVAASISSFGISIFQGVGKYFLAIFLGILVQFVFVYPLMLKIFSKVSVAKLYGAVTEAAMVAFGTASSSATLPLTITCCEKRGISSKICSFVLPLGATLNMDGTALVQTIAVLFLTQAYGIELSALAIVQICFLAIIASSTCAGIPGAGLITIALVLNGIGLTPEQMVVGFAFLFALDRLTDMLRTTANVVSDTVVAAIIADNANEINYELFNNPELQKDII
ncbi:MAG: dicarboxylate/amino acid:cation symporter [Candidatus Gastranaerophilales bacterium]|nr:dicarboxylate/amino acid:cation symporter [Candidatus Gastranaerophilales bacterium]